MMINFKITTARGGGARGGRFVTYRTDVGGDGETQRAGLGDFGYGEPAELNRQGGLIGSPPE